MNPEKLLQILKTIPIDPKLKKIKAYAVNVIKNNNAKDIETLANELASFNAPDLIVLYQQPEIANFIKTNNVFNDLIKQKLQASGHPTFEIKTMNGKETYELFQLYLSASYASQLKRSTTSRSKNTGNLSDQLLNLNNACLLGSYDALLTRCLAKESLVKSPTSTEEKREEAINDILNDVQQLANTYWGVGYFQGGFILFGIGLHFLSLDSTEEKMRGRTFIEQGIQHLLCASYLSKDAYSNQILNQLTHGNGLPELLSKSFFTFKTWDEAIVEFQEWVGDSFSFIDQNVQEELASLENQRAVSNTDSSEIKSNEREISPKSKPAFFRNASTKEQPISSSETDNTSKKSV